MKLSELFPSKYLKAADVKEPKTLTIQVVELQEVGMEDDKEQKPVIIFTEGKSMVLNKTNATELEGLYGDDTANWAGKKVVVYFDPKVRFKGKATGGLKIRGA